VPTQTETTNQKMISKDMRIGLFIPCYIDMIFPEVRIFHAGTLAVTTFITTFFASIPSRERESA
jgi:hypothetical protein